MKQERGVQTDAVHGHGYHDEELGVFIPPIYQTAVFEQPGETRLCDRGTPLKYSREENLTVRALEHALSKLERGEDALCFSSGMAAISTTYLAILKKGDRVVIPAEAYGTTIQLTKELGKYGVEVRVVWPETESVVEAVDGGVRLVLVETVTNPMLRVFDLERIAERCREEGVTFIVDNTFTTPVLCKPLELGAGVVVHSMTKYISGHNDVLAGSLISSRELVKELWDWRRKLGSILHPFEAFLVLRGLKTLELRVRRHCENAIAVAEFLEDHPKVEEVYYPGLEGSEYHEVAKRVFRGGFGGVVSFRVKGGMSEAVEVMRRVRVVKSSPSLGGAESLLSLPVISASSHIPEEVRVKLGITDNLLRLSVGLEDVEDILEDLDQALNSI